ncbi:hypothetical protein SAMN05216588_12643 [Pseudomonas flavescens]|uniref:Uncharacterized protein n=1 Tax=Phytopseudomonas flavescens TaxID=29435 RepID=A0A1G8NWJ2_9GAMM|nr:hypothetical protein [Pseudomonas flavescens]SDI84583.1 hypothetical protein SAMN05216588_12643 [Pseudomonas flavescens]
MRNIETDRRSFIPLRRAYLFISALVLVVSAIVLLNEGLWGIFAFCCLNAPFLAIAVYLKDGTLKRFNETLSSLADI